MRDGGSYARSSSADRRGGSHNAAPPCSRLRGGILIAGVGNPWRGDDGAGIEALRAIGDGLKRLMPAGIGRKDPNGKDGEDGEDGENRKDQEDREGREGWFNGGDFWGPTPTERLEVPKLTKRDEERVREIRVFDAGSGAPIVLIVCGETPECVLEMMPGGFMGTAAQGGENEAMTRKTTGTAGDGHSDATVEPSFSHVFFVDAVDAGLSPGDVVLYRILEDGRMFRLSEAHVHPGGESSRAYPSVYPGAYNPADDGSRGRSTVLALLELQRARGHNGTEGFDEARGSREVMESAIDPLCLPDMTSVSTHRIPIPLVGGLLARRAEGGVYLVGVQVKSCAFGREMSREVSEGVRRVADAFVKALGA